MEEKSKRILINLLGVFFLFVGALAVLYAIYENNFYQVLWLCYLGLFFIGIGFLMRKGCIVVAQLNILLIPLIIWDIDFFYMLFNGQSLLGIADYFLYEGRSVIANLISLQHVFTLPLAIFGLFLLKVKRKDAWKFSLVEMGIIFAIGRLFTSEVENVNCVFKNCLPMSFGSVPYWLVWFIVVVLGVLLVNYIFVGLDSLREKK